MSKNHYNDTTIWLKKQIWWQMTKKSTPIQNTKILKLLIYLDLDFNDLLFQSNQIQLWKIFFGDFLGLNICHGRYEESESGSKL